MTDTLKIKGTKLPSKPSVHPDAVKAIRRLWAEQAEIDEVRWAYREAAAVLDVFDPDGIQPFGAKAHAEGYSDWDEDAAPVSVGQSSLWRLSEDIRHESLLRIGDRQGMRAALQANPKRKKTVTQSMLESLITKRPPSIKSMSQEQLRALLTACRWVEGVLPAEDLPDQNAVATAFAKADLLAPSKHLVADGFVDRVSQLGKLKRFLWQDDPSPPMMLYGIGGVGKSTLLAKLTIDEVEANGERLLFVPIDVDRPSVRPHRPHTFFIEAVTQIIRQVPKLVEHGESVKQHLRELGSRYSTSNEGYDFESERASETVLPSMDQNLVQVFSDFLTRALPSRRARALITIDTFEEAQVLGSEVAAHIVGLFSGLANSHSGARVVISGRIRADQPAWMKEQILPGAPRILLKGLDKRSAKSLLRRLLQKLEIKLTTHDIHDVISMVGRNPMCVKLAARIIQMKGAEALLNEEARQELLADLREAKIQAFLFGRILDHFQTQRIRPVAYPGLIVRRVNPDIIREVLAGPCGLELEDAAEADKLFRDLAREKTMVEPDGTGGLRYRPDLRRELLPDVLDKVAPETAAKIDENAIDFYSRSTSREDRAEEIYHRLRLGVNLNEINSRWGSGMRDLLRSAIPELPDAGRIWLARKLNITVDAETRREADQSDWEQAAELRAKRYLKRGDAKKVLATVRERSERLHNSPLFTLEAEALRLLGEIPEAKQIVVQNLERASGDCRAELLLQLASMLESEHKLEEALPLVAEAVPLSEGGDEPMLAWRALITHVRLLRKLGRIDERDQLRQMAIERLSRDTLKDLRRYPRLFEETAAELGDQQPEVLAAAAQRLGVQVRSEEQQRALADVFHESWEQGLETRVRVPKNLDQKLVREMGESFEAAEELVRQSEGAGLGRFAADLVKAMPLDSPSNTRLADYFRDSVEQGLDIGRTMKDF